MINLRTITTENVDAVCELKADRNLVADNASSLADAFAYWTEVGDAPLCMPFMTTRLPWVL